MIFSGDLCAKVLSGEKTQTRRLKRGPYKVGGVYAVQPGRGKKAVGHIKVKRIWESCVLLMPFEDVRAEGFGSHWDFYMAFRQLNGLEGKALPSVVWAFEFELEAV